MNEPPDRLKASAPSGTKWFGGAVDTTRAVLRVMPRTRDEAIDVGMVTEALGCAPNDRKPSRWALRAPDSDMGDLDSQIDWLLSRLTSDIEVWRMLSSHFRIDLFCGLYLLADNRGIVISTKSMAELSMRGIELGLDIYSEKKN